MPNVSDNFWVGVEALQKHMLLTAAQMATVLGTSRVTYSGWIKKGKPIRKGNLEAVKTVLKKLYDRAVIAESWPSPSVLAMSSEQRFETLLELMKEDE